MSSIEPSSPWRVLLLGGASGVGKTALAHKLARHYGVSLLLVDDVRLALQQVTTAEQQPALHYFLTTPIVWRQLEEDLLAGFIGVATAITPALGVIVVHHLVVDGAGPLIIEGDGVAPRLVGKQSPVLPHVPDAGLMRYVRALIVDEPENHHALVIPTRPLETLFERTLALVEK
jgi:2-phosphoglycerate kinase